MNMVMQEKPDDKGAAASQTPIAKVRPVARVSPRIAQKPIHNPTTQAQTPQQISSPISSLVETNSEISNTAQRITQTTSATATSITTASHNEPLFMLCKKLSRNVKIYRTLCKICKRRIVCLIQKRSIKIVNTCKKCRKAQGNVQLLPKTQNKLVQIININEIATENSNKAQQIQVDTDEKNIQEILKEQQTQIYRYQRWQPSLDGKVVSKLRRLGTTLARDSADGKRDILIEGIKKPQWERQLDDDEILLDFNTTISEVLPIEQRKQPLPLAVDLTADEEDTNSTYRVSVTTFKNLREKENMPEFDHQLPKGLTIVLDGMEAIK